MNRRLKQLLRMAAAIGLALHPVSLFACSACYGDPDSSVSNGLTWAITALIGVISCVLAGVVAFSVRMNKKSGASDAATSADEPPTQEL